MKSTILTIFLLVAAVFVLPFLMSPFLVYMITEVLIMGIFAMSLGLIMGFGGLHSLGHSAFFGLGAYTVVVLSQMVSSIYVLLLVAILIACAFAFVTGLIAIRSKGIFFLMLTFAFTQMLYLIFSQSGYWGGADGLGTSIKPNLGFVELTSPLSLFYLIGGFFILSYLLLRLFVNSPLGTGLQGVMENENRMIALGYNVRNYKVIAYIVAGGFAGLAGGLYAFKTQFASPDLFGVHMAATVIIMVYIGGMGTLFGPVLGAGIYIFLQNYVSTMTDRWSLIMGLIFIALVLFNRGGALHLIQLLIGKVSSYKLNVAKSKGVSLNELAKNKGTE
ncbi:MULTISPECIES: branched-chain amino acid ABC transporter permease [unclassified Sporosarcina]|uniref:branched-chain amino acid ABC transporter permease n=1 Tax=unclassified Sporosarcina TaxID=2647733 RepID=UPI000C166144|nr:MULTISPECIES: branched-chain amino acid ABC transporter permease [unclassified Sporosarcina]PID15009.1 branched-chain amino acid ABC transporter permease [Sporosarcina sp. P34]PID25223.1 branched-chain amino acid ABC transporter permease [Sporosarcina sp. P7]